MSIEIRLTPPPPPPPVCFHMLFKGPPLTCTTNTGFSTGVENIRGGWLKSIHWGSMGGGLKIMLKNTCGGVHLIVKLPAISLPACKFTKNELLHSCFWRILARFYVIIYCAFSRNQFKEGYFMFQWEGIVFQMGGFIFKLGGGVTHGEASVLMGGSCKKLLDGGRPPSQYE